MATMNRPNTEQSNDNDQNKPIVVDPLGQLQKGEVRKLDVTDPDDAWKRSAPLQGHRWYKFRLNPLAKDACSLVYLNPKNHKEGFYYTANLELEVVSEDPELKGQRIYETVSTRVGRGKEISTMAAILIKFGVSPFAKGTDEVSDGDLLQKLAKVANLMKETKTEHFVNWKAGYFTSDKQWQQTHRDYDNFPDDGEGGKLYEVDVLNDKRVMISVNAKAFIMWSMTKEEAEAKFGNTSKKSNKQAEAEDVDDVDSVETPEPPKGKARATAATSKADIDDGIEEI